MFCVLLRRVLKRMSYVLESITLWSNLLYGIVTLNLNAYFDAFCTLWV